MKNPKMLLALLAALALVFAGACSSGDDGASVKTPISDAQVEVLLKAIGTIYGTPDSTIAWDFEGGDWADDEKGGYQFTVTWSEGSSDSPGIGVTLENLQKLTTSTAIVTASFSEAEWAWDYTPTSGSTDAGQATLSIRSANPSYYVPEALATVTIIFDPNGTEWKRNPVTPDHVKGVLQSIGEIDAVNGNWDFSGGSLNEDANTFTVTWGDSNKPDATVTLESLKEKGTMSKSPVQVDLRNVSWKGNDADSLAGTSNAGKIEVTITLADDATAGYELYQGATSLTVIIDLNPGSSSWREKIASARVEELIKKIGAVNGRYDSNGTWNFTSGGNWTGNDNDGYTFTVKWTESNYDPIVGATFANLKTAAAAEDVKTDYLAISSVDSLAWDSEPSDKSASVGEVTVTITSIHSDYYVPEALKKVTIAFDPNNAEWDNSYYIENGVYHVSAARGLLAWKTAAQSNLSTSCVLENDIDLSGQSWTPIASGVNSTPYTGVFDGNYHTIYGLSVELSAYYVGFFGYVGASGEVKNLTLDRPAITATFSNLCYSGGIAGYNNGGTIENCHVSGGTIGTTSSSSALSGGIVAVNYGTVENCSNSAAVSSTTSATYDWSYAGGIVGHNYYDSTATGTVRNCTNSGSVTSTGNTIYAFAGGIAGRNTGVSMVENCTNTGTISAAAYAGGIVGFNDVRTITITGCANSGNVSVTVSRSYAGGIAGFSQAAHITDCTNTGKVKGEDPSDDNLIGTTSL